MLLSFDPLGYNGITNPKYNNAGFYICPGIYIYHSSVSSYSFDLLSSVSSFQPEGIPLAFLVEHM